MQPTRSLNLNYTGTDFPGDLVVKTSPSNAGGTGSISGQGAKIPHASGPKNPNIKKKKKSNIIINSIKPLKMVQIFKSK